MFFSLIQTLVCVLLVNGGLYALHLTGSGSGSGPSANANGGSSPLNANGHSSSAASSSLHLSSSGGASAGAGKNPSSNPFQLADLAQRERERLMTIGLAKQTAEESGYHGRPVITGRIKMHPVDDMDSDYANWLNAQARNVMFGSVVKQPSAPLLEGEEGDYNDGELALNYELRRPTKYEYGRVVQPPAMEREFESPHTLDMDDFMELETAADEEDVFPDLDGYAYLEDLAVEENKERLQHQNVPQFPGFRQQQQQHHLMSPHSNPYGHAYQTQEHMQMGLPQALEEILEKEQQQHHHMQQQQQHQQQHQFNPKYRNNIKLQQKWARKRAQQQQLPRNIFGQKNKPTQQQQHFFKTLNSNKLSLANSEATATSKVHNTNLNEFQQASSSSSSSSSGKDSPKDNDKIKANGPQAEKSSSNIVSAIGEQQKPDQLLHPSNHKRSGSSSSATGGGGGLTSSSAAAIASVTSPHSLANQLMLRSARGQRQYDVPQIECPTAMDGMERFACPTPDVQGRYRCIDDHVLCDGFIDCPEGEDEDRRSCMFYKTTKAHLDVLADALLRWARGR
uniref:Chitin-binding type-2 domain-containing protein n=1 Tax=Stomoxys calcitrans TaxID=35570 RepID=A0A1I8P322_STOCA